MPKYHNFKKSELSVSGFSIPYYIDNSGHDSNTYNDPNNPRKSIISAANATYSGCLQILGAGEYTGALHGNNGGMIADGKVTLSNVTNAGGALTFFSGFRVKNSIIGNFNQTAVGRYVNNLFTNSTTVLLANSAFGDSSTKQGNIFINHTFSTLSGNLQYVLYGATVIAGSVPAVSGLHDSYISRDSVIIVYDTSYTKDWRCNNLRGIIRYPLTAGGYASFAIKDQLTGTPQDNGYEAGVQWLTEANLTAAGVSGSVTGINTAVATWINRNPKFLDESAYNFGLQADSPHIRRANGGIANIGYTSVATSIQNSDHGNGQGVKVGRSAEIDTTDPLAYKLLGGVVGEGYIDYVFPFFGKTITSLDISHDFNYNTNFAGGTTQNKDVPDAEPLTSQYARLTTTTGAGTTTTFVIPTGLIIVGNHVRVLGEAREVTAVTNNGANDTITVNAAFRASIGSGIAVTFGTEAQLAALTPNNLTVHFRTRSSSTPPTITVNENGTLDFVNAEWDNEVSGVYNAAGQFLNQVLGVKPGLIISNNIVYGAGDSLAPTGVSIQELAPQWGHVRVYLRNNLSNKGI